jgi:hypothetical protein
MGQDVMVVFVMMENKKAVSRLANISVKDNLLPISADWKARTITNACLLPQSLGSTGKNGLHQARRLG